MEYTHNLTRNPDFLLCAFPKVGSTWLKFILMHYMNFIFDLKTNVNFNTKFSIIPNAKESPDSVRGIKNFGYFNRKDVPFIVSDEDPYDKVSLEGNILWMTRGIYDIIVSQYFHNTRQWRWFDGSMKEMIRDPKWGVMRYVHYMNSWSKFMYEGDRNIYAFSYECLSEDPVKTMTTLIDWMKIPMNIDYLSESIRLSSFDNMLREEIRTGIPEHDYDKTDKDSRRVREGKIGGWKNYLDEDDVKYMKEILHDELNDYSKSIIKDCGLHY